jgi:hypothetical protein
MEKLGDQGVSVVEDGKREEDEKLRISGQQTFGLIQLELQEKWFGR